MNSYAIMNIYLFIFSVYLFILYFFSFTFQADLKVVSDAKGQTVYRDHLPLLGEQGPGRTGPHGLQIGDQVLM